MTAEMSSRERLMRAFRHEAVDHVPYVPKIWDNYFLNAVPESIRFQTPIQWTERLGCDMIVWAPVMEARSDVVEYSVVRDGDQTREIWETPVGSLIREFEWLPAAGIPTGGGSQFPIRTLEDLKTWTYICEHTDWVPVYDQFLEIEELLGEEALVITVAQRTPVHQLSVFLGFDRGYYFMHDYPNEMEAVIEVMLDEQRRQWEIIANSPAIVVCLMDDGGTDMSTPTSLRRYNYPHLAEYSKVMMDAGKIPVCHMCGYLRLVLQDIKDTGLQGIEPVTPPPVGDVSMSQVKAVWGDEVTVWGGVDNSTLRVGTVSEVEAYAKRLLKEAAPGRSVILGSGGVTHATTPLENLQAFARAVKTYGRFPVDADSLD